MNETKIDEADIQLLKLLDEDARLSISALARSVGMSAPSVSERLRKLERDGIVKGFTLDVGMRELGYQISAIVRIRPLPGRLHIVERLIQERPEFIECDKITGEDPFIARLVVRSIEDMDEVLEGLAEYAVTNTSVIKGKSVKKRLPPL